MKRALRHPLLLLLLGTLLGSVLIPYVSSQAAHSREIEELRTERALAALQESNNVDRRLNVLVTSFGTFWADTNDGTRESRQDELREKIYRVYEEFDRTAWWWFDEAWQTARYLNLLDDKEAKEARDLSEEYKASLLKCTAALDEIWRMSLTQNPLPSQRDADAVLARVRKTLGDSRTQRLQVVGKLARMLSRRG